MYTRVSKGETQHTENQSGEIRDFVATQNGWLVVHEYADTVTGGGDKKRPEFDRMMADAAVRTFDLLVFWSLDRFSREGTGKTLCYLARLDHFGVGYRSLKEPFLDNTGPFKEAVISIMATLAKIERTRIIERVNAGLAQARKNGTVLGRPRRIMDASKLCEMSTTRTLSKISEETGISKATISRRINAFRKAMNEAEG